MTTPLGVKCYGVIQESLMGHPSAISKVSLCRPEIKSMQTEIEGRFLTLEKLEEVIRDAFEAGGSCENVTGEKSFLYARGVII